MARGSTSPAHALLIVLALLPLGALSASSTATDILAAVKGKLEKDPKYSAFFKAYFSSTAPLELYTRLSANKKVTLFIPNAAALNAVPATYKSKKKFGSVVLDHTIEGIVVSRNDFRSAKVKKDWTSEFQNNKIRKTGRDTFTISGSRSSKNATVVGWNFYRYKNSQFIMHVVDHYAIPKKL